MLWKQKALKPNQTTEFKALGISPQCVCKSGYGIVWGCTEYEMKNTNRNETKPGQNAGVWEIYMQIGKFMPCLGNDA